MGIALLPVGLVLLVAGGWPAWVLMWAMAVAVWLGFKWIMWRDADRQARVEPWRRIGFFIGWAGTDAVPFLASAAINGTLRHHWARASVRTLFGAALIWLGVRITMPFSMLLAGWVGMIGTVLLLHFGLFELIAVAWRRAGIGVEPIMCRPVHARSVADFWNRWNRGFRDLAYRKVFRPLHRRIGLAGATFGAFLFSGFIHDLMISVPAGGGYGLPTVYFLIQFLAVIVERAPVIRSLHPFAHWLLTCAVVAGPLRLLFHDAFVQTVFLPFLVAIGAT